MSPARSIACLFFVVALVAMGCPVALAEEAEFAPKQDVLPVPPPKEAVVLFDGEGKNLFLGMDGKESNWKVDQGEIISTPNKRHSNFALSKFHFRDAEIHAEFNIAPPEHGNSGLYIHGHYEMQIVDSAGKKNPTEEDVGSLYRFQKPLVNAARPIGEWQVYDIRYKAPRRDEAGKIVEQGEITAWLNGQKVQDKTRFGEPRSGFIPYRNGNTPYIDAIGKQLKKSGVGPLFLQDHGSPCRFRNLWIKPLDDKSVMYEPPAM